MANQKETVVVPDNFHSIIIDLSTDLSATFPEYSYLWSKWIDPEITDVEIRGLFEYCIKVFPERFFDILYQNDDIFKPEDETNTYFLPNVSFRLLFNTEDITENTKKAMWKYLQLILFTIVGSVKDKSNFGDTMNMFDGIDENDLQEKLKEAMGGIGEFFSNMTKGMEDQGTDQGTDGSTATAGADGSSTGASAQENQRTMGPDDFKKVFENMPNIEKMQEHLKSLFEGKIGSLAKEMAEEIAGEFTDILGEDAGNIKSTGDVMKKLMKDPKKIMSLMKTVGSRLDNKMKSGEVSREELMKEASEMMNKMKEMGGGQDLNEMMKEMAKNMGGLGKNMRFDTNAMNRMTKMQESKDRLRKTAELRKQQREEEIKKQLDQKRAQLAAQAKFSLNATDAPNNFVFKLDGEEAQEKSFIHPDLLKEMADAEKAPVVTDKKKKNKKKK
jgi:Skp family chaperone for outer membrane proteins